MLREQFRRKRPPDVRVHWHKKKIRWLEVKCIRIERKIILLREVLERSRAVEPQELVYIPGGLNSPKNPRHYPANQDLHDRLCRIWQCLSPSKLRHPEMKLILGKLHRSDLFLRSEVVAVIHKAKKLLATIEEVLSKLKISLQRLQQEVVPTAEYPVYV